MSQQDFIQAGFRVLGTDKNENKLLNFLKEHYPSVINDNEINLQELKIIAGLPIDEKVNGYGLNFVGRNFARAKYAQKSEKELHLNTTLSKNIDTTQNLVLKGDNLDSLKILKSHYSGKIKCIYIDPPYNTANDEFIYPDKFNKEEAEVLGMANLSEDDFARMDFSFKTKKSHNGWLAFMYPRLLLARDLLSKDGVIFISIDDNEQANLKLLCDDVFGEENFVANLPTIMNLKGNNDEYGFAGTHEYTLVYAKNKEFLQLNEFSINDDELEDWSEDDYGFYKQGANLKATGTNAPREKRPNLYFPIFLDDENNIYITEDDTPPKDYMGNIVTLYPITNEQEMSWRWSKNKFLAEKYNVIISRNGTIGIYKKQRPSLGDMPSKKPKTIFYKPEYSSGNGTSQIKELLNERLFSNPKPLRLVRDFIELGLGNNDIILDFFAGSGTTAHAVMQLNAEDGGNRKFILCQIDEPIKNDKPAYKFCVDNNLPPVISSITIERLKRAGEKITQGIQTKNNNIGLLEEDKKQVPDTGFKVFDSIKAPKLIIDDNGQISINFHESDTLSRIYTMIFTIGLDEPTQAPEVVVENCIYKIGNNFYVTNSEEIKSDDFASMIKNGTVFVDGWSASLNATLQNYKEDVKIVF
jgi:adenine-specific DNA-methyltransferase